MMRCGDGPVPLSCPRWGCGPCTDEPNAHPLDQTPDTGMIDLAVSPCPFRGGAALCSMKLDQLAHATKTIGCPAQARWSFKAAWFQRNENAPPPPGAAFRLSADG